MLLEGKTAIVSGIGPGMGRDISLALAREGADIALGARKESNLVPVAEEVADLGRRVVWVPTDITDRAAGERLVSTAVDELGGLDILVNNAFRTEMGGFEEADLDQWRRTVETNLFGTLELTQAALPALKEAGDGRIVMINTQSVQQIEEGYGGYAASKGALFTVTKTLARELGPYGIRVNSVVPSYIWGPNVQWYFEYLAEERGVTPQDVYDEVAGENALRYIPDSAEIAGTVVFLASDLSRPVTGQAINVSGGAWMP